MATITHETLALGQLPNTQTDIYDPASGVTGCVHNITLHNTNTSTETVEIWKHNGTTAYKVLKISLAADETFLFNYSNDGLTIDGAHKLQGKTTTASKVTYDISGTKVVL
jgi:hypothetical protein